MLDMQLRIRQKEAKRKEVEAEEVANKKRCDREERIAKVQLQAYWQAFPLPTDVHHAKETPAPDSGDDELTEAQIHEIPLQIKDKGMMDLEQELIEDGKCEGHRNIEAASLKRNGPRMNCPRTASSGTRQELLNVLQASIDGKTEADAKRVKLDPQNSREGADPKAINRDVDSALKDPMHTRIHSTKPRAGTKRACTFDDLAQSCKASKIEMRAILNICDRRGGANLVASGSGR